MSGLILKGNKGDCLFWLMVITVAMIILFAVGLPFYIESLSSFKMPAKDGAFLIYEFSRADEMGAQEDKIKFKFNEVPDKQVKLKVTEIYNGSEYEEVFKRKFKFEDSARQLYIKGVAPVWYPKNRLGKGANILGKRVREQKIWNGWDVWVAGEAPLGALYYERNTGYLVGFDFIMPENVHGKLIETNIEGL